MSKRCVDAGFVTVEELNSFHLEYSVKGSDGKVYTVDMAMMTCSCEQFDKDKFPCVHAVAAATFMTNKAGRQLHLSEYCSKYYLVELWALAYHRTIYHVPHMTDWVVPEEVKARKVVPPYYEVKKGRTQHTRYPSAGESRGRGRKGKGSSRGRGRARGGDTAENFDCGSGSGAQEVEAEAGVEESRARGRTDRGNRRGRGRARRGGLAAYFECGSGSGEQEVEADSCVES